MMKAMFDEVADLSDRVVVTLVDDSHTSGLNTVRGLRKFQIDDSCDRT